MKTCFKCGIKKEFGEFYKHKGMADKMLGKCKGCCKYDCRKNYQKNRERMREYDRYRTRYNFSRIFQHRYTGMKSRIEGTAIRPYKVEGKKIMSKDEFITWCHKKDVFDRFQRLHQKWVLSNFDRNMAPSIDRVDNDRGYTLDNIRWITMLENVKKYNH